ncbi:MAG: metallopeptidase family protein [Acidimicrobiia bacterium]|nr:metallopeptidase family protein [Acidimicrobiia bacterium]
MNMEEFEAEVDAVLASLPPWVNAQIDNLIVVVEPRPSRKQDPTGKELLGLYEGVSLAERGIDYFAFTPDQITVFYRPHMELGLSDEDLRTEIRTTVLHELAHHLGIDDDRLLELGWG